MSWSYPYAVGMLIQLPWALYAWAKFPPLHPLSPWSWIGGLALVTVGWPLLWLGRCGLLGYYVLREIEQVIRAEDGNLGQPWRRWGELEERPEQ